jgi:hypothetical protein
VFHAGGNIFQIYNVIFYLGIYFWAINMVSKLSTLQISYNSQLVNDWLLKYLMPFLYYRDYIVLNERIVMNDKL